MLDTGTAGPSDYAAPGPGTLTFATGDTARRIPVPVIGDTAAEEDETIVVELGDLRGLPEGGISVAVGVGTIEDDDRNGASTPTFAGAGGALSLTWRVGVEIPAFVLPAAEGGDAPIRYELRPAPPAGLRLSAETRTLSGTPTALQPAAEYRWTATDRDGDAAELVLSMAVAPNGRPQFEVTSGPDLRYWVGRAAADTLPSATGGDGALRYAVEPDLPPGLQFDAAAPGLRGAPTEARERQIHTLTATDEDGDRASLRFSITVGALPRLTGWEVVSSPREGDTYAYGETIELEARLTEPVTFNGGVHLALGIGPTVRRVPLASAQGSVLRFRHSVAATDRDPDGVSLAANAVSVEGEAPAADLSHAALPDQPGHRVDGAARAVGRLPSLTLALGGAPAQVEVAGAFRGAMAYAAVSSAPEVASVALAGTTAEVTAVSEGTATVTVRGRNPGGVAEQRFEVTVAPSAAEAEVVEQALGGLGRSLLASATAAVGRRLTGGGSGGGSGEGAGAGGAGVDPGDDTGDRGEVVFTGLPTDDRLRAEEALSTARAFSITARRPGGSTRWTMWSAGDLQSFRGGAEEGASYDGSPLNSWIGVDASRGRFLAGLAVARTTGEVTYSFSDAPAAVSGAGTLDTTLLQVHPYVRWSVDERTRVWGHGGVGRGSAELTRSVTGRSEESRLDLAMGAAGLRRELGSGGGASLALRADFGGARLRAVGGGLLEGKSAAIYRGRLGLEASREFGAARPFLEVGGRYDGGAGANGAGLELAGGVRVADRGNRFGAEARARLLALHTAEGYRESGAALTARYAPSGGERGLSVEVGPTWGAPPAGAQALWTDRNLDAMRPGGDRAGQWVGRMSYGFPLFTPFTEVTWSEALSRSLRAGVRLGRYGAPVHVELAGSRRQQGAGEAGYRLDLYGRIRIP